MTFLFAARVLFAALLVAVAWASLTPDTETAEPGFALMRHIAELVFGDAGPADKVGHFLAYAALGASAALARLRIAGSGALVVGALALYGAALEGGQALGGVREAELADAIANTLGAATGYPAAAMLLARFSRRRARA